MAILPYKEVEITRIKWRKSSRLEHNLKALNDKLSVKFDL